MTNVLLVEDNADLAFGLTTSLEIEGYSVNVAEDGPRGLEQVRALRPDLVILDLMLPRMDGYRVLETLRAEKYDMPVLILTARAEEADKVHGFRLGADDYVTKPFGISELVARVEALLRRAHHHSANGRSMQREQFGQVEIDPAGREVRNNGVSVALTPKEFDLLLSLVRRRGAVASRFELLKEVWGHSAAVTTRTVDVHIAELRRKLESDPGEPKHILTVWKSGYRLVP